MVPLLLLLPCAALAQERPGLGARGGNGAIESAVADFTARRYDEAETAFRALHERDPGAGDVLMYLGRLALLRGDDDGAVQWLERAIRADGDDARHHHWLGRAYAQEALHAGLLRRARLAGRIKSAFERAVELDPAQIEARLDLLRFYVAAPGIVGGSVRAAREQARAIAGLDPMWGHIARGLIAEKEKDAALAEREYRAALASHVDRAAPYHALGAMYQRAGRFADAFAIYASLRAALPAETSVLYQIGRTASISGDELEAGTRALTRYLEIPTVEGTPLPASAHYRLALIHERRGLYVEATRELERAARLEPDRDDVREALERLRRRPSSTSAAISPLCSGPATAHTAEVPAAQIRWSAPVTPSTCLPKSAAAGPTPFRRRTHARRAGSTPGSRGDVARAPSGRG